MTPWRKLHRKYHHATQVDVARYVGELDSIDEALVRAEQWAPGPFEDVTRIELRDTDGQPAEMFLLRPPTVPVRAPDPARLAVALLQHADWEHARAWDSSIDPLERARDGAELPSALTLLRRKLKPDPAVAADLLRVAITAAPNNEQPEAEGPAMYLVLTLIERLYDAAPPKPLRKALEHFLERVKGIRERERAAQRTLGNRVSTKRLDGVLRRVGKLLGTA